MRAFLAVLLIAGCSKSPPAALTQEDCVRFTDHIGDLTTDGLLVSDALWDGMHAPDIPASVAFPPTVTQDGLAAWLASPDAAAWKDAFRKWQRGIAGSDKARTSCLKRSRKWLDCILATKSLDDISHCQSL